MTRNHTEFHRHKYWWRWRESNPRPKVPLVSIYKLRVVF